jgi:hypothetical protein
MVSSVIRIKVLKYRYQIKCQWRIEKPLKFTGRFGYGRKK